MERNSDLALIRSAALIALDWGTSSLRAFLLDAAGTVRARRDSPRGILNLALPGTDGFEDALETACGDWLGVRSDLPVVAGGMVGSAQGWREAPYVPCPADVSLLARHAVDVRSRSGVRLVIAPGVRYDPPDGPPDVMRGEEIQIAGALEGQPGLADGCGLILPGTHSKWVEVTKRRIGRFTTFMTGELFAVLQRHSILGRLMPEHPLAQTNAAEDEDADAGFQAGLAMARTAGPGDLGAQLFSVRTLGLTRRLPPHALRDYLSGLLIGHEIVAGLARSRAGDGLPMLLVGDAGLCRRYARALRTFGVAPVAVSDEAASRGLYRFAVECGLLQTSVETNHA